MRYSIAVKFIAIVLCAISLVAAVACGFGIVQVTELGLYTDGFDGWIENRLQWQAHDLAKDLVDRYAVRKLCPAAPCASSWARCTAWRTTWSCAR